jgi:hypothetical protein
VSPGEEKLRAALRITLAGLMAKIPTADLSMSRVGNREGGQADYLLQMVNKALDEVDRWPVDKLSRWIGFLQGVLYEAGALDIREERGRTRPYFHAAYRAMGIDVPESWEGK